MNTKELIAEITRAKYQIEAALEDNGGELTPELLEQYDSLEDLKALLAGDGIDDLGRWLKSVQDELAARKAEADAAARRVKNLKGYEDYVKGLIGQAMDLLDLPTNKAGEKVAKGTFYGFKRTTSHKGEVLADALKDTFGECAEHAARLAGIPTWVQVEVKATATALRDAGGDALRFLEETTAPAISFTKPRASKEA